MNGWLDGWMDGWLDGWMVGWMDGWMDGWLDGWMEWASFILCHSSPHCLPSSQAHWPCTSSTLPANFRLRAFIPSIPSAWTPLSSFPSSSQPSSSYPPAGLGWDVAPQAAFPHLSWNKSHFLNPLRMYLSPSTTGVSVYYLLVFSKTQLMSKRKCRDHIEAEEINRRERRRGRKEKLP